MFANPVRNVNVNPSLPWWCTKKSLFRFKLNGVVHMFTVISIFCSNKWQARNQVFLTGRYDPTTRGTKRGRRHKSLGGGGWGEFRCLRLHFKRFEGSVERKQAAKRRNVDISQNVWTLKLICLAKKLLYVCILKMRMAMAMLLHVFERK